MSRLAGSALSAAAEESWEETTSAPPGRREPLLDGPDTLVDVVVEALGHVLDPELDEPVTDLGFVDSVRVADGETAVDLRLPTYFCAPNFAYLMVADARDELSAARDRSPALGTVRVRLIDHFASEEINGGVAGSGGFDESFDGLADGELDGLRAVFRRKAHLAAQERLAVRLQRRGVDLDGLAAATLGDLDPGQDAVDLARLRVRRRELGLPAGQEARLLLDDDGAPMDREDLPLRLRFARATRVSIEGNASLCRGLLATRYDLGES